MCNLKVEQFDDFLKEMIEFHGFSWNEPDGIKGGFSCYIADPSPFGPSEGLLLWKRSRAYEYVATELQKFHAEQRIYRMKQLGCSFEQYSSIMKGIIKLYIKQFCDVYKHYNSIGSGVVFFQDTTYRIKNYSIAVSALDCISLRRLELFTINNCITESWEKMKLFSCLNKDKLLIHEYCPEIKDIPIDEPTKSSSNFLDGFKRR